jgi:hypothetical protein
MVLLTTYRPLQNRTACHFEEQNDEKSCFYIIML